MPTLDLIAPAEHAIKMLLLGDSGSGKSGSLASLALKYKLRIYDFDNGTGYLANNLRKLNPAAMKNVAVQTFRDKFKAGADGPVLDGPAEAFSNCLKQLDHWNDPISKQDFGKPASWSPTDTVVVLDSLTFSAQAAFRRQKALNPTAGMKGGPDPRQLYFATQENVQMLLSLLTSEAFKPNVIVIAHIDYDKNDLQVLKGFPRSIGSALNTSIATYFNTALLCETVGIGANAKRFIKSASTGIIDLKSEAMLDTYEPLPIETGLATFFAKAKS